MIRGGISIDSMSTGFSPPNPRCIYLSSDNSGSLLEKVEEESRGEETEIDLQYLRTLHNKHEYWLNQDKHGDVPDEPAGFTDSTLHSICFLRDGCLSTLRGIPVLVLDFDENLNVNRSSHAKRAMRRAVASFVSFVQKARTWLLRSCADDP